MVHVALIGAGGHSSAFHAPALARVAGERPGDIELTAVCDRRGERAETARSKFRFQHDCREIDELFDRWRIDAAVVVMPVPLILETLRVLLPRRIPLMIEKPLGVDLAQARAIAAAAREGGAPVQVSLNRRFDPGLCVARAWLRECGPVRRVRGAMVRANRLEPEFIWSTGIHMIDLLQAVVGPLTLVAARPIRTEDGRGIGVTAILDGAGGVPVSLDLLPRAGARREGLHVAGDGYDLDVRLGSCHPWQVEQVEAGRRRRIEAMPFDQMDFIRNGAYNEAADFLAAVAAGRPLPGPSPADVLPGAELADRLQALAYA